MDQSHTTSSPTRAENVHALTTHPSSGNPTCSAANIHSSRPTLPEADNQAPMIPMCAARHMSQPVSYETFSTRLTAPISKSCGNLNRSTFLEVAARRWDALIDALHEDAGGAGRWRAALGGELLRPRTARSPDHGDDARTRASTGSGWIKAASIRSVQRGSVESRDERETGMKTCLPHNVIAVRELTRPRRPHLAALHGIVGRLHPLLPTAPRFSSCVNVGNAPRRMCRLGPCGGSAASGCVACPGAPDTRVLAR